MASNSIAGLLIDGFIVFLYFAVIIAIGLYKGRGSKKPRELCGRRSQHSLVGGPGLDPRRRDQRGDISWRSR